VKTATSEIRRHKAVLSRFRLTESETEVEFWEYSKGFLEHAREVSSRDRGERGLNPRRLDNMAAIRNNVRRLVNSNAGRYGYEAVFLTFTFRENLTDIDLAWSYWHAFMRRMRSRFGALHALSVMEFQKRGAVHFHCIFFNLPPSVEKNERKDRTVAILWGLGFVDIERIRSAKNVGAYVCKYLNKSASDARLQGKKFYSTTRNLFRPTTTTGDYARDRFLRIVSGAQLELSGESVYSYGGSPVHYYNYRKICLP